MARILVLNGPNLNLLGTREPQLYGSETLAGILARLDTVAAARGAQTVGFQSNAEHELIAQVQGAKSAKYDAIIVNAGALTHTSIALRDALAACGLPFYEVHISNVYARETFRHHSYLSSIAAGIIVGCGPIGYELALEAALRHLQSAR